MPNIPASIKNRELYSAYLDFLKKVIDDNQHLFTDIWKLKESRRTLDYNPSLKSSMASLTQHKDIQDVYLNDFWINDGVLLHRIVDFVIDGLYQSLIELEEYKNCVRLMDSDEVIKKQVNKSLSVCGSLQFMRHWTYLSHFLKTTIFRYLDKCEIEINGFNGYFSDLQSFFYEEYLDMVDIAPLHHFQVIEFKDGNVFPVPTSETLSLSDRLHIVPLTLVDKIRLWNKFPISRFENSFDGINYLIEYKFTVRKGFEGTADQGLTVNTLHIFTTIVTLFRFIEIHCGIHDKATMSYLDLPIQSSGINLFVASLGVAYNTHPYAVAGTVARFKQHWAEYGDLLVNKVINNQRFDGDPFANLKIAINRFNDAFERKDGTDQFIDNIVALEALFSKEDDGYLGVTVRLSRRLALFLEIDPHKRKETFCEMVRLYDSRGRIIHGGYTEEINIVTTRNYLIKSFLKYFKFLKQDNFSHADFIRSLDTEAKNFSMNRDDCRIKHIHNNEYNHSIPDFLFQ